MGSANDSYDYKKGVYSTIPLSWDDGSKTLTIGVCSGTFLGMLETRTFRIVFVREDLGVGAGLSEAPDKIVSYSEKKISVVLRKVGHHQILRTRPRSVACVLRTKSSTRNIPARGIRPARIMSGSKR